MGVATAVEPNYGNGHTRRHTPTPEALDTSGLDLSTADLAAALAVDPTEWLAEVPALQGWLNTIGPRLPASLHVELDAL